MNSSLESDLLWQNISEAERNCRIQLQKNPNQESNGSPFCPGTFDGWSCWNETPAGQVAYTQCPSFITGFDPKRFAKKSCLADGTWFRHPETNVSWSNYTSCVDVEDLLLDNQLEDNYSEFAQQFSYVINHHYNFRQQIMNYYIIGYSVSLVALVLSMVIFFYFKSLRCCRITIHKNLFLSFILNNIFWIAWHTTIDKSEMFWANEVGCQIFHVLLQYFLMCNYFWMFCEGLYLHTILVMAFVNENVIMMWLYVIGWLVPAIFTILYGVIRGSLRSNIEFCWIDWSPFLLILIIPVCISMLVNLMFLINIVSVLVTKIREVNSSDINQTKKAVRATLILIPLLGLHFLMMPFRPDPGAPGEDVYQTLSAIVTSLQGLSVSCLFCFFNGEVLSLISRRWTQTRMLGNRSYSMAATTVSFASRWKSALNGENEAL